jgi:hypothetical protein
MKQKWFLYLLVQGICLTGSAQSKPFVNVYAYSQVVSAGVNPGGVVQEGGTEIKVSATEKINYYFYAEYPPKEKLSVSIIYIKGKPYRVKTAKNIETPVRGAAEDLSTGSNKMVLVPETSNKVILLLPALALNANKKHPAWLKDLLAKNEVVIACVWKGKTWYFGVPKIKMLPNVQAV